MKSLILKSLAGVFLAVNSFTLVDGTITGYHLEAPCADNGININWRDRPYALKGTYRKAVQFGQSVGLSQGKAEEFGNTARNALLIPGIGGESLGGLIGAGIRQTINPGQDWVSVIQ